LTGRQLATGPRGTPPFNYDAEASVERTARPLDNPPLTGYTMLRLEPGWRNWQTQRT